MLVHVGSYRFILIILLGLLGCLLGTTLINSRRPTPEAENLLPVAGGILALWPLHRLREMRHPPQLE